jgi:hypothetical protein
MGDQIAGQQLVPGLDQGRQGHPQQSGESDHDNSRAVDRDNRWDNPNMTGFRSTGGLFSATYDVMMYTCFVLRRKHDRPSSPAPNPGNVAAKPMAQIDRSLMQR